MSNKSLTEPLLERGDEAQTDDTAPPSHQQTSSIDNVKEAIQELAQLQHDLEATPSNDPVHTKPQLEYEPSDFDKDPQDPEREHPEVTKFTSKKPVWQTCPYCNTTSETTAVNVFGKCTCIWVCVLLVLCFPLCWLPFFWKDCHDTKHYCTYCNKELGRCKAKCCQFQKMGEKLDEMDEDAEKCFVEAGEALL